MSAPQTPRPLKFAAIDVGTNAVRLLLSRVFPDGTQPRIKKESLVRIPLRLGEDVFSTKRVSREKQGSLLQTLQGFRQLMEAYGAIDYMACGTSAMREAENGADVVAAIRAAAGIDLEVIDGRREAEIICTSRPEGWPDKDRAYLFVDVGGGSTEVSILSRLRRVASASFDIGGVRLMQGGVPESRWADMKRWLRTETRAHRPLVAIGSGGNINKIFRLARKKEGASLSYKRLRNMYNYLRTFSLEQRIHELGLRPDRADVIIPASEIYLSVMKWSRCRKMLVPMAGLSDGLIYLLYQRYLGEPAGSIRRENAGGTREDAPAVAE
jgi:exopolyphosphatase/guanosine-5'-triphosphate,3'-diphosphate pyrophosphatase